MVLAVMAHLACNGACSETASFAALAAQPGHAVAKPILRHAIRVRSNSQGFGKPKERRQKGLRDGGEGGKGEGSHDQSACCAACGGPRQGAGGAAKRHGRRNHSWPGRVPALQLCR